jgi:hypothetical protein
MAIYMVANSSCFLCLLRMACVCHVRHGEAGLFLGKSEGSDGAHGMHAERTQAGDRQSRYSDTHYCCCCLTCPLPTVPMNTCLHSIMAINCLPMPTPDRLYYTQVDSLLTVLQSPALSLSPRALALALT